MVTSMYAATCSYVDTVVYTHISSLYKHTARNCLVLQVLLFMVKSKHDRVFNVITKGIFKALCSSHNYYVPAMITSAITNEAESCI